MRVIPISSAPAQRFQVVLDGQYCNLILRQKAKRLYLDLSVADFAVCAGAVCVHGADIIQSPSPYFSGSLHFLDISGQAAPQWEELNSRFVLLYLSADEAMPDILRF